MREIRFGIIGCGLMGREFASAIARWCHLLEVDFKPVLAGICDTNPALFGWYQQRLAVEADAEAKAIMAEAQAEEFKHFGMDLEFLLRRQPRWRKTLRRILFTEGDIVSAGDEGEEDA